MEKSFNNLIEYNYLWGQELSQPYIAVENIKITLVIFFIV